MALKTWHAPGARRDGGVPARFRAEDELPVFRLAARMAPDRWCRARGLPTSLALAYTPVGQPALRAAGGVAARAALLGAPIMIALFLLFPRMAPLWGLPQDAGGRTGLSGTLALGGVAALANDDSVALRVRFEGGAPPRDALYFRGPVLSDFDGREWQRARPGFGGPPDPAPELLGAPVRYEMTVEPSAGRAADARPDARRCAQRAAGRRFRVPPAARHAVDRRPPDRRAAARAGHGLDPLPAGPAKDPTPALREALRLPPDANPRTLQWADTLRNRADLRDGPPSALVAAVLEHIGSAGFTYTLEPGPTRGDAIDEFWFDRKLGFCEHFAAGFVVVMRAMGVPARIVTGYQGSDPQPADGWWVVRQSNAHAWAEVWLGGQGWVRVDPTAAVAPDRVRLGLSLSAPQGLVMGTLHAVNPAIVAQLRGIWEQMDNRWNQWVLNYSRRQQFDLLGSLGVEAPSWEKLAYTLMARPVSAWRAPPGRCGTGAGRIPGSACSSRCASGWRCWGSRWRRTKRRAPRPGVCAKCSAAAATRWRARSSGSTINATHVAHAAGPTRAGGASSAPRRPRPPLSSVDEFQLQRPAPHGMGAVRPVAHRRGRRRLGL